MKILRRYRKKEALIRIDSRCVRCGYCVRLCPLIFRWAEESEKNRPVPIKTDLIEKFLKKCEAGCPVAAISVIIRQSANKEQ